MKGYQELTYAEPGTYGVIRLSGTQTDICYGKKSDFDGRGHVVIQSGSVVYVRNANDIPAICKVAQSVQTSGLNAQVSGGSLLLLEQKLNTSGTSHS